MKDEDVRHLKINDEVIFHHPFEGDVRGKVDAFRGRVITIRCDDGRRMFTVTCDLVDKVPPRA